MIGTILKFLTGSESPYIGVPMLVIVIYLLVKGEFTAFRVKTIDKDAKDRNGNIEKTMETADDKQDRNIEVVRRDVQLLVGEFSGLKVKMEPLDGLGPFLEKLTDRIEAHEKQK